MEDLEHNVNDDLEVTCPRCKAPRLPGAFFQYQELEDSRGRYIRRRHVMNCVLCRANDLIETNVMPPEFSVPEYIDGVWDYTAAYRKYQDKLAEDYVISSARRSLRPAAEAAAFVRRARDVIAEPAAIELRRRILKGSSHLEEFNARTYEWLLMYDVCSCCSTVKRAQDFVARKKRGRGHRYEFKSWCAECRSKFVPR